MNGRFLWFDFYREALVQLDQEELLAAREQRWAGVISFFTKLKLKNTDIGFF